jgi:integrase
VPIGPELHRALERYLAQRARKDPLFPNEPLFRSRFHAHHGGPKPITRSMAEKIIKRAFRVISDETLELSSHSLRKSWAMRLYEASGHDLLIVRDGLARSP